MENERIEYSNRAQVELRNKLSELNIKFESRIKEMEININETCKQQNELIRIQDHNILIKKCEKDIETVRTDERRSKLREIENLRSSFKERERQTSDDLIILENLHNERLSRLENQNQNLIKRIELADRETQTAKDLAKKGSVEVRLQASQHMQQAEDATRKAEAMLLQSTSLKRELQESRVRESTYREQLNNSLEENRLQRAEMLEAQKQAQNIQSEAMTWRKQAEQADMTYTTSATTVQIAKDEIRMLEYELNRVKEDNYALQQSLIKAEKLVYGSSRSNFENHTSQSHHYGVQDRDVRSQNAATIRAIHSHSQTQGQGQGNNISNSHYFRNNNGNSNSMNTSGRGGRARSKSPGVGVGFGTAATGRL